MFALALLCFAVTAEFTSAQDSDCDFVQNVEPNQFYDIASPNYPGLYPRDMVCRWIAICPMGYNCVLECPIVNLPATESCSGDSLLVSLIGDYQLNDATRVCDRYTFRKASIAQTLSLGFVSTPTSPGGNFMCRLYAQVAPPQPICANRVKDQNRIVGGQETGVNEFRMMAALIERGFDEAICGGAIITDRYIATAAHCLAESFENNIINEYVVLVGGHDLQKETETSAARTYDIREFQKHPDYNPETHDKDIAVVMTEAMIEFNDAVRPVCPPFKYMDNNLDGSTVTIIGWGTTSSGGPVSNTLQKVEVSVISQDECRKYEPTVTPSQICTLTPGKDSCQHDSGGPILLMDDEYGWIWVGTVSYGHFCGTNAPSLNTRITMVLDWIVRVTGASCCMN